MIVMDENQMVIICGEYEAKLPRNEVSYSNNNKRVIRESETQLEWVKNNRIKLFFLIKIAKGKRFEEACNMVFDKLHLHDEDYRNLIN